MSSVHDLKGKELLKGRAHGGGKLLPSPFPPPHTHPLFSQLFYIRIKLHKKNSRKGMVQL